MVADFSGATDTCTFFFEDNGAWVQTSAPHPICFKMDLSTGCRAGLFLYATKQTGGCAVFTDFTFLGPEDAR